MTLKDQGRDPNTLMAKYLENSWRCYLETIAKIVCSEAVRSVILATAWLLVTVAAGMSSQYLLTSRTLMSTANDCQRLGVGSLLVIMNAL